MSLHITADRTLPTTVNSCQKKNAQNQLRSGCLVVLTARTPHDFNSILCSAIDDTIIDVLGRKVLESLYEVLETKYDITRQELPYRTETMYKILETTFGVVGAKTVGTRIAQKFYAKLGLPFHDHDGYALLDYVEAAKTLLAEPDD